jgi:hypothetical protein
MSDQSLTEQVEELGLALQGIERELASGNVPHNVLDDFKTALDHTRMTLWAVITTASTEQQAVVAATIVRYRLTRSIEMLRHTLKDIAAGEVTPRTPEFPAYREALQKVLDRLDQLS